MAGISKPPLSSAIAAELEFSGAGLFLDGLFYGMYCILVVIAIYYLIRKGLQGTGSLARRILLGVLVIMFISDTILVGNNIASFVLITTSLGPDQILNLKSIIFDMEIIAIVFPRINYVLSDAVVVWRAWVLYDRRIVFRLILAFCMLATLVINIVDGVLAKMYDTQFTAENFAPIRIILPAALLFTNLVATACVAYKSWEYRRAVKTAYRGTPGAKRSRVEQVLLLLVESGFLYCFVWVMVIVTTFGHLATNPKSLFDITLPQLTAIYPTVIIILVMARNEPTGDTTLQGGRSALSGEFDDRRSKVSRIEESSPQRVYITSLPVASESRF